MAGGMSFELTEDQQMIRKSVAELAGKFDDQYWMEKDLAHEFPQEFYDAIAKGGWLGMTIPEEYGGHGLGITEATLLLEEVARSGAAMNGASAIHLTIFGMQPVVKHGSDELKAATLPRIVNGDLHVCFGVTEPGAGLDTSRITTFAKREGDNYLINGRKVWISKALESEKILLLTRTTPFDEVTKKTDGMTLFLTDLDRDHVDIRPIKKMGRNAVSSNELFIDDLDRPGRGPCRRGGQGVQVHPRRAEPGTDADRRRGAGHRSGGVGEGREVRQRARRLRPSDRHEPGTAVPAGRLVGAPGRRRTRAAQGHVALRQRKALWARGEYRQVPVRGRRVRRRRPRAADCTAAWAIPRSTTCRGTSVSRG